jgi:anti-sigma-K factor RskA
MSHKLSHSQILEELPAYVLGALEPEEMLAIDDYLQDHPEPSLLARLQELEVTVVALAATVPDVPLPSSAKAELLGRVEADLAVRHEHQREVQPLSPPIIQEQQANILSRFGTWLRELFSGGARPLAWTAVGALTVILLAGSTLYQLQQDLRQSQAELQVLQREFSRAEAQIEELHSSIEGLEFNNRELQIINKKLEQEQLNSKKQLAVLTTQQHQVSLAGTPDAASATGTLFFTDEEGLLILDGLMPLPEEQDYQVWLIPSEGAPEAGTLIEIPTETTTSQLIELPGNPLDYAAFGISQEPAGGSDAPTLVVMVGTIQQ